MAAQSLGDQIEAARNAKGLTQEALADLLGRGGSVRAIQDWENNRRTPHPRTLAKLRQVLNMPGDEEETRATWPARVQVVAQTVGRVVDTLPEESRRAARHEFISAFIAGTVTPYAITSDDAEIIQDLIGAYLAAEAE